MSGNILLLPILIVAGVGVIAAVRGLFWSPADDYATLLSERRAAGVSAAEFDQEMNLRYTAAILRRRVSIAVLDDPAGYETYIRDMAREEAMLLAVTDQAAAKGFVDWVETALVSEILYPAAMRAVWKTVGRRRDFGPVGIDLAAALRVRA